MFIIEFLFVDAANKNLLLGSIPESVGLLIFGAVLIASAAGLRRIFNRNDETSGTEFSAKAQNAQSRILKTGSRF